MKVAIVVPSGFDRPTASPARSLPVLHSLVKRLSVRHDVHVFCTNLDAHGARWTLCGATIHDLGRVPSGPVFGLSVAERARRLLCAMRSASTEKKFDIAHAFGVDGNGVAAAFGATILRVPLVASVWGGECVWLPEIHYGGARTAIHRMVTRVVLGSAKAITVGSEYALAFVPASRPSVIVLGADRDVFDAELARVEGPPWRLIHIAHQNRVKDPQTMLNALRELKVQGVDFRLDWFGVDTLSGQVQRLAGEMAIADRIVFRGDVSQHEIANTLRSAHLHVMSSRYESQCVALLEAALAGVPTVGTNAGLVHDLAPRAAVAVSIGDSLTLAGEIARLLSDRDRRRALALSAQRYAREHDATFTSAQFEKLYGVVGA